MEKSDELSSEGCEDGREVLGPNAFIAVSKANCLYHPDIHSAVRIIPPYGTTVMVVRDEGAWVLIRFCGKEAWSPRENLSAKFEPRRPALEVGIVPPSNYGFKSQNRSVVPFEPQVEYGPRGGRFVRTTSGFKRYF
jgi:hypothetical protein